MFCEFNISEKSSQELSVCVAVLESAFESGPDLLPQRCTLWWDQPSTCFIKRARQCRHRRSWLLRPRWSRSTPQLLGGPAAVATSAASPTTPTTPSKRDGNRRSRRRHRPSPHCSSPRRKPTCSLLPSLESLVVSPHFKYYLLWTDNCRGE